MAGARPMHRAQTLILLVGEAGVEPASSSV